MLHNLTCSLEYQSCVIFFTEWFQIQREFATPFEEMLPPELNKCLQKFFLSVRKWDGSFRTALDRHLRSPSFSKPTQTISEQFLKTLSKNGQIASTMHKQPLTKSLPNFTKKVGIKGKPASRVTLTLQHSSFSKQCQTSLVSSSIWPETKITLLWSLIQLLLLPRSFKLTAISNSKYFWSWKSVCFWVHSRWLA